MMQEPIFPDSKTAIYKAQKKKEFLMLKEKNRLKWNMITIPQHFTMHLNLKDHTGQHKLEGNELSPYSFLYQAMYKLFLREGEVKTTYTFTLAYVN